MEDWIWITELPHYRYGWSLFAVLAILPALVSGNMLIHELGLLWRTRTCSLRAVLINLAVLAVCLGLMMIGIWQWA